jgi:hypothetical protein
MKLRIESLTPELWPAFEDLFGKQGACNGCWCMNWRIGRDYQRRSPAANKADLKEIVRRGPAPGLLAFDGDLGCGLVSTHAPQRVAVAESAMET